MNLFLLQQNNFRIFRILMVAVIIFCVFEVVAVTAYSVGTDQNIYTVGTTQGIFTVGSYITPAEPISFYIGAKQVLVLLPGLMILGVLLLIGFIGFREVQGGRVVAGILVYLLAFVLVGLLLLVGMPIILDGMNSIVWFK